MGAPQVAQIDPYRKGSQLQGKRSPTLALAKSLGLEIPEPPELCEICDGTAAPLIRWLGVDAHESCLPGHWRRDRAELLDYMAAIQ